MRPFRDYPIRRKLTLVLLLSSGTALTLLCLSILGYEYSRVRDKTFESMNFQAKIVEANVAAALAFDDRKVAREVLAGLREKGNFVCARIYRMDGRLFADYVRPEKSKLQLPARLMEDDYFQFGQGQGVAVISRAVKFDDEQIGVLAIQADLEPQQLSFQVYVGMVLGVMLVTLVITLLVARRMQSLITEPLLELAALTRSIRKAGNYSLQASVRSRDEVGQLTREFNEMIAQIKRRDEALQANEERFRQLAENIQEVFWMTSTDKKEMLYISPAYERIWGRSCAEIIAQPMDWLEAIHPEDRERVTNAALTKQLTGNYNEEYRIHRPDGTIRWIRDRAFPVCNAQGQIYRVAGIAEDITERRRLEEELLNISEREQARIGQDLHDSLCQQLVRAALASNLLAQDLAAKNLPAAPVGRKLAGLLQDVLAQSRAVSRGLYPVKLEAEGLASALKELALSSSRHTPVQLVVDCDDAALVKDHAVAVNLYRIAQEALNNALKHAAPQRVAIHLSMRQGNIIFLQVNDDGKGMTPSTVGRCGMGMHIMAYRARLIGGTLKVANAAAGGVVVSCSVRQGDDE